jgi:hypothetical protein
MVIQTHRSERKSKVRSSAIGSVRRELREYGPSVRRELREYGPSVRRELREYGPSQDLRNSVLA